MSADTDARLALHVDLLIEADRLRTLRSRVDQLDRDLGFDLSSAIAEVHAVAEGLAYDDAGNDLRGVA